VYDVQYKYEYVAVVRSTGTTPQKYGWRAECGGSFPSIYRGHHRRKMSQARRLGGPRTIRLIESRRISSTERRRAIVAHRPASNGN
jgi:hypothetical protein